MLRKHIGRVVGYRMHNNIDQVSLFQRMTETKNKQTNKKPTTTKQK
jgi:hypothetical protein